MPSRCQVPFYILGQYWYIHISILPCVCVCVCILNDFIYFLERGREGERERNNDVWEISCLSRAPSGDLTHNPGMYPDRETNWWPLGSQADAQPTEPHQTGLKILGAVTSRLLNFLFFSLPTLRSCQGVPSLSEGSLVVGLLLRGRSTLATFELETWPAGRLQHSQMQKTRLMR